MSRHEVPGRKPNTKVFVGWDQPMLTFFVQVYDPRRAWRGQVYDPRRAWREGPRVWLGGSYRELYDLDDLKRAVRPHAELSAELLAQLYGERDRGDMS